MSPTGPIQVVDKDGRHGTIEAQSRSLHGDEAGVAVWLDDGRRAVVPADKLEQRAPGQYYLPAALVDFVQATTTADAETITVPVVEEQVTVQKRAVEAGRVRVQKTVHEHDETVDQPVFEEAIEVERVPIGRPVDGPIEVRYEGDTMIVPVLEEVLVVEKRLILKEEVRITRHRTEVRQVQHVTLRKEEVNVERLGGTPSGQPGSSDEA